MTDNVISLIDHRKKKPEHDHVSNWAFNLDVFDTDYGAPEATIDFGANADIERGAHLRLVATTLDQLSFMIRQEAEKFSTTDDGVCLAQCHVFENSRVRVCFDDQRVTTSEQFSWLDERWEDAKVVMRENRS